MNIFVTSVYLPYKKVTEFNQLNDDDLPCQQRQEKSVKRETWSQAFLKSEEWKSLRAEFMAESKQVCVRCGATENLQADHIKPKYKFKDLALVKSNLQVLCWPCNRAKSFHYSDDSHLPPK